MSQTMLLKRPFIQTQKKPIGSNMFAKNNEQSLPQIDIFRKRQLYDYVGPNDLKEKVLNNLIEKRTARQEMQLENAQERSNIAKLSQSMQTTINRRSVLSNLSLDAKTELTKDQRRIKRYRDYQQIWSKQIGKIKKKTQKNDQLSLIETAKKQIQVIPNEDKDNILKTYVTSYWQMSLRNNSVILKRHLKGNNRYSDVELQGLLQRKEGITEVQNSIPKLPVEKISKLTLQDLSVGGKSKLGSEALSANTSVATLFTNSLSSRSQVKNQVNEEVFLVSYDGSRRWMADELL